MRLLTYTFIQAALGIAVLSASPDESLEKLIQGNQRYVNGDLIHKSTLDMKRESLTSKQNPFAIVLGCSDSRVAPEIIFDQDLGDIFVVRIAGNVVTPEVLASIEYASVYLGASLIMVLGHESCGAVDSVIKGITKDIEPIAVRIQAALKGVGKTERNLSFFIRTNVNYVAGQIRKNPVLKKMIDEKKTKVVGGFYFLDTGKVELVTDISNAK